MTTLDILLEDARRKDRTTRIRFRDEIAAHGSAAIRPVAAWLTDRELGGFGVRVLLRIAEDAANRPSVVAALRGADGAAMSEGIRGDVAAALAKLRPVAARPSPPKAGSGSANRYRDHRDESTVETRFHNAMLEIFWLAGEATGYWANYFLRGVRNKGGLAEAKDLLRKTGTSPGFERLRTEGRIDLSMEALILRPEFSPLFSAEELQLARDRLEEAGFVPD